MIINKRMRRSRGMHGFDRVFIVSTPVNMTQADYVHCVNTLRKVKGATFVLLPESFKVHR